MKRSLTVGLMTGCLLAATTTIAGCGSGPDCTTTIHHGHKVCTGKQRISTPGGNGFIFVPVFWRIGDEAPIYVYHPPPAVEDPTIELPDDPADVSGAR